MSIFDEGRPVNAVDRKSAPNSYSFAKWPIIGTSYEGTLVDVFRSWSTLPGKDGNPKEQIVYTILQPNGEGVNIAESATAVKFHEKMSAIALGQNIGIKYVADLPPKVKGYNPTKIKEVFARSVSDPNFANQSWIESHKEFIEKKKEHGIQFFYDDDVYGEGQTDDVNTVETAETPAPTGEANGDILNTQFPPVTPITDAPMTNAPSVQETNAQLKEIADLAKQLGATTPTECQKIVTEKTSLNFEVANYRAIIEALKKCVNDAPPF